MMASGGSLWTIVEPLLAVERHDRLEPDIAQPKPDRPSDLSVVVDDQDTRLSHLKFPSSRPLLCGRSG